MAGGYGRSLPKHSSLPGSTRKVGHSKRGRNKSSATLSWWTWLVRPRTCLTVVSVLFTFLFLFQGGFVASFLWEGNKSGPNPGRSSSILRKSSVSKSSHHHAVEEAVVDISMKALYDKIAFDDRDGGVWKQGWDVKYGGREWDEEVLKVFVVPHSHNDPGWIRTVEEYYQERSRHILDTIVASLLKDPRRKFIWEEISYLERWWRDASQQSKSDLIRLAKSGQLEIVGGGWVMNDEANSHYFAIIEQMTAGNLWLLDNVGVAPKNAWAIDPFGHSPTMAYLLRRMGFENMLIQRTHYEVKKELAWNQNLEFNWRQSWDSDNSTDIFCHMMPFYSYDIPHTCGPEPGVCCQFDYWRIPGKAGYCPWNKHPQTITSENVKERAELLLDQYRKKSILYRSNTLLVPLGDDFRYIEMAEADLAYENYQRIFDYVNSHPNLKAEMHFGTLEDYFSTLRKEVSKKSSVDESTNSPLSVPGFPSLAGDFFTYADIHEDYWSGYYVTRPFYKAVDRVLEQTLRAADILFVLAKAFPGYERPALSGDVLERQRRNLALFQHHDGVTGTAKDHVVVDYANKMHDGIVELEALMAASVGDILSPKSSSTPHPFESVELRKSYDNLPVNKVVEVKNFEVQRVVFYNPLEETLQQVATVMVDNPGVCVFDSSGKSVDSQLSPDWGTGVTVSTSSKNHRLHFHVKVAPLGLTTYLITAETDNCDTASVASLSVFNEPKDFTCPEPYFCSYHKDAPEKASISNEEQTLIFSTRTGLLMSHRSSSGIELPVEEEIAMYTSSGSGAYLFRPSGEATPVVKAGSLLLLSRGPLLEELYTVPKFDTPAPLVRSARLYSGKTVQAAAAEFEYYVDFAKNEFNDRELITRFKTELNNKRLFYTDLNGFQTMRRETYTYSKIPLQGNYYPMPSLAFLQCPGGRRFSIHSRQALGVASLNKGELEIMLDRRLIHDDGRGLGQGIMDNRPSRVVFQLLVERNVSVSTTAVSDLSFKVPSLLSHLVNAQLNYPVHAFFDTSQPFTSMQATTQSHMVGSSFSPLRADLPCDLHIVAMKLLRPAQLSSDENLSHGVVFHRRGVDSSYPMNGLKCEITEKKTFDLFTLFSSQVDITKLRKASLSFLHNDGSQVSAQGDAAHRKLGLGARSHGPVDLNPMELQAYKFDLKSVG